MYYKLLVIHKPDEKIDELLSPFAQPPPEIMELWDDADWQNAESGDDESMFAYKWKLGSCSLDRTPLLKAKKNKECYLGDAEYSLPKDSEHGFCSSIRVKDAIPSSLKELTRDAVLKDGKFHEMGLEFSTYKDLQEGFYDKYLKGLDGDTVLTNLICHM